MSKLVNKTCGIPFSLSLFHPRYWLTWLGLSIVFIVSFLSTKTRHTLGRWLGNYIFRKSDKRRDIINANLKIAFPELGSQQRTNMIQKQLQWYGCALVDYSLLFFASKHRLSRMLEIEGQEHIDKAIKQDKSVMILLAHSVMLEFAPTALGAKYDCFGSYKTSKNGVLDWMIARSRCRHVSFVVSREEGMRKLVKALVPKRLMIFLPDEDLGPDNAVFAPFFGIDKATLSTTARLAKMGKAIALPSFAWFDEQTQKYKITIVAPLKNYPTGDAIDDARLLNQALETLIKAHPAQYMWTMKWFRTRPNHEASLYDNQYDSHPPVLESSSVDRTL